MLRFWLNKGVSGIRVDAVESLYEVLDLEDEVPSGLSNDSVCVTPQLLYCFISFI